MLSAMIFLRRQRVTVAATGERGTVAWAHEDGNGYAVQTDNDRRLLMFETDELRPALRNGRRVFDSEYRAPQYNAAAEDDRYDAIAEARDWEREFERISGGSY